MKITAELRHSSPPSTDVKLTDSCYVSVVPTKSSVYRLISFLENSGENLLQREYLNDLYSMCHVTIMYSKEKAPEKASVRPFQHYQYNTPLIGTVTEFEECDGHNNEGYLVAKLDSPDLSKLHEKWKLLGCEHSFKDYEPHITIISPYIVNMVDVVKLNQRLKLFPMSLEFVNERAVPVT